MRRTTKDFQGTSLSQMVETLPVDKENLRKVNRIDGNKRSTHP